MMVWFIRILQLPMFFFYYEQLHRISIAVIKPHNQKQLGVESIYFISHVPITIHNEGMTEKEPDVKN